MLLILNTVKPDSEREIIVNSNCSTNIKSTTFNTSDVKLSPSLPTG
jgi:hypothetical protein